MIGRGTLRPVVGVGGPTADLAGHPDDRSGESTDRAATPDVQWSPKLDGEGLVVAGSSAEQVSRRAVRHGPAALVVGIGGVVGSLARAGVGAALGHEPGEWGWATLVVNASGCFALAVLLVALSPARPYARLLLGTGVLGGYTTFSAFSVDAVHLLDSGRPLTALAYVVLSVTVMLCGALAGRRVAQRSFARAAR